MNLSTELELGLKRLCNPALVSDKCFRILLQKAEKKLGTLLEHDTTTTEQNIIDDGKIKKKKLYNVITLDIIL